MVGGYKQISRTSVARREYYDEIALPRDNRQVLKARGESAPRPRVLTDRHYVWHRDVRQFLFGDWDTCRHCRSFFKAWRCALSRKSDESHWVDWMLKYYNMSSFRARKVTSHVLLSTFIHMLKISWLLISSLFALKIWIHIYNIFT